MVEFDLVFDCPIKHIKQSLIFGFITFMFNFVFVIGKDIGFGDDVKA